MSLALNEFYDSSELLPTVRELLSHHPEAAACGMEELANWLQLFAGRRPQPVEVEAALEALLLDSGEVAA